MRLIDGDALWKRLNDEPWENNADRDEIALPIVNAAPTVDAEVVVEAKWIPGDKMPNYPRIPYRYNRHYCSACEQPAVAYENDRYNAEEFLTPRCPECGARIKNGC